MKKYFIVVGICLCANLLLAQQWSGSTTTSGVITRTGNIEISSFNIGRYGNTLAGDSNPLSLSHGDGQRDLTLFGNSTSTLHLRLYDGDLKLGLDSTPTSTFYNTGNLLLGGTVGDRLVLGGLKINVRLGYWSSFGETGGALNTIIGSNVKSSTSIDNRVDYINTTPDGGRAIQLDYLNGITFHAYYGNVTAGNEFAGYERMRITNSGNVGIGTTTPDYKLTVNGKIKAEEQILVVQNVADYVFHDDYDLMPLEDVESYVKQHKHLPGVPSKAEIDETGFLVGHMTNKVLEKVEELTLHLIELKKENEELKKELDAIKKKLANE